MSVSGFTVEPAVPEQRLLGESAAIYLDEIGDLPLHMQLKLLRVIEEKIVWAVGSTKPVLIDARIIASTNRDLVKEIEGGRFREDLFYRLNVVHIAMTPLRERREDVPLLLEHFVRALKLKLSTKFLGVDQEALRVLINHPWKGNGRDLERVRASPMILVAG